LLLQKQRLLFFIPSFSNIPMHAQTIRFVHRGKLKELHGVSPSTTLLEALRENMSCLGTKEGCGEGDCGACTVVLAELENEQIRYKAINSCIRTAHSLDGKALWTVEDLTQDPLITPPPALAQAESVPTSDVVPRGSPYPIVTLHPVQQALVQHHASQCGFCTPGFVMSLFAQYQHHGRAGTQLDRAQAQRALSGNLCRCTGYRPILDAAQDMLNPPKALVDEHRLKALLVNVQAKGASDETPSGYMAPTSLQNLLRVRALYPKAQVIAGATDVGLWITKLHQQYERVLDVSAVQALRKVETYPHHMAIGAAVSLEDAFSAMGQHWPELGTFFSRFAGLPVRNSGTLGGNIANGSPIGDSMPLLIALGANVVLSRINKGRMVHRELRLEDLYTGYRTNVMRPDELLTWVKMPLPTGQFTRVYKVSKRIDDDISAVCLGLSLVQKNGQVVQIAIGAGGVAATPKRASQTELALQGLPWTLETAQMAGTRLLQEFQPLSDLRASSHYRQQLLRNLMLRFWHESQGKNGGDLTTLNLENLA
jgi:xanthine dehydrogenase small subunit